MYNALKTTIDSEAALLLGKGVIIYLKIAIDFYNGCDSLDEQTTKGKYTDIFLALGWQC